MLSKFKKIVRVLAPIAFATLIGCSGASNGLGGEETGGPGKPGIPETPQGLSAVPGDKNVNLSWSPAKRATLYKVLRAPSTGGPYKDLASTATTSYTDSAVENAKTYFYVVRSANLAGESPNSAEVSATPKEPDAVDQPPSSPSALNATPLSPSQIRLVWNDNSDNELGFKLERKTSAAGTYSELLSLAADATTYVDGSLVAGQYYYRISAYNNQGVSDYSNEVQASPKLIPVVTEVLPSSGSPGARVTLNGGNFGSTQGSSAVLIGGSPASAVAWSNTMLEVEVPTLAGGLTTVVVVVDSVSSTPVGFEVTLTPLPPSGFYATAVTTDYIALTWNDAANNEAGFNIERKEGVSGSFTLIATLPPNATSYDDIGLQSSTGYFYRMYAINAYGVSSKTPVTNATTKQPTVAKVVRTHTGHSCAITSTKTLQCWGSNSSGQLGDGTTVSRSKPQPVTGLYPGVSKVSIGDRHTCALLLSGGVKCWGGNSRGQLGDGTTVDATTPIAVSGLSTGVVSISSGDNHTCALLDTGGVKCWGANNAGNLGNTTTSDHEATPAYVSGLVTGATSIATGWEHSCAVLGTGKAKCWGYDAYGQLGDGTNTYIISSPANVLNLTNIREIEAGAYHTCALLNTGAVYCWGTNGQGQLGDGSQTDRNVPTAIPSLSTGVLEVSAGLAHSCANLALGGTYCWGSNMYGQIGDGTTTSRLSPTVVSGFSNDVTSVSAGGYQTCVALKSGSIKCSGWNYQGSLGDAGSQNALQPVPVDALTGIASISSSNTHNCILGAAGGVKCWGYNESGGLGDGSLASSWAPVDVATLGSGVRAVKTGDAHSCALLSTGGVSCWGGNSAGQLGDGTFIDRYTPVSSSGLVNGVSEISLGHSHSCALLASANIKCWGANEHGQLGDGSILTRNAPVVVSTFAGDVSAITTGDYHSCALLYDGSVKCWGGNGAGQVGDQTLGYSKQTPTVVGGLAAKAAAIEAGGFHTCAILSTGAVQCWGSNENGQLGDGTTLDRSLPVTVIGLSAPATALAAGRYHTCALQSNGAVRCWGLNRFGQLGDDTTASKSSPVAVIGLSTGVSSISAGAMHTCAILDAGTATCWGMNDFGQLGNLQANRIVPALLKGFVE